MHVRSCYFFLLSIGSFVFPYLFILLNVLSRCAGLLEQVPNVSINDFSIWNFHEFYDLIMNLIFILYNGALLFWYSLHSKI